MQNHKYLANIFTGVLGIILFNTANASENGTPTTAPGLYDFGAGFYHQQHLMVLGDLELPIIVRIRM